MLYDDYIPPSMFQIPADIYVITMDGSEMKLDDAKASGKAFKKLVIKPRDAVLLNTNYTVVLDGIKGVSGSQLEKPMMFQVSSEFGPMYATPIELRPILRGLFTYFTLYDMYVALRDAGQKAHQMLGLVPDVNSSRYRPMQDNATYYFPTTKYVVYEAAKTLLSSLLVNMLNQQKVGSPTESMSSGDTVTLGDFSVSSRSNSSSGSSTSSGDSPLKLVEETLTSVAEQLKFWQDAMLGRNKRGYASPVSVSARTAAGSPADRSIDA
jgi:hypothetical protein